MKKSDLKFFDSYVSLDIETDGFGKDAQIMEIGAVRFSAPYIVDRLHVLVYPYCRKFIDNVPGFTEEDAKDSVDLKEAIRRVIAFVGCDPVIGARPSFDIRIINQKSNDLCGPAFEPESVDICAIAKELLPGLHNHKLDTLIRYFNIAKRQTHRAAVDAEHATQIYELLRCMPVPVKSRSNIIELPVSKADEELDLPEDDGLISEDPFGIDTKRMFTVESALFPCPDGTEKKIPIILYDGIPDIAIVRSFWKNAVASYHWTSTKTYDLCAFLNYLDKIGVNYPDATMGMIYQYVSNLRVFGNKRQGALFRTIEAISDLYESLALFGVPLDKSLFMPYSINSERHIKRNRNEPVTCITRLKNEFRPDDRDTETWTNYQKWYTKAEIDAIADVLSPVFRCIFLISIFTGYRIGSILSMRLDTIDLRERMIWPTHLKTNILAHKAYIPKFVADELRAYIEDVRVKYDDIGRKELFLSTQKTPLSYNSYYNALQRAHKKVCALHPDWDLKKLHTHAGRSTFAAALRTYQLSQRRAGVETFSDEDICILMDWKSLQCLHHYDLATRPQEISPVVIGFHNHYLNMTDNNRALGAASDLEDTRNGGDNNEQ